MENRKNLIDNYKQRKIIGGVFRVVNTRNGKYLLDYATNLQAKQNTFNFNETTNGYFEYKMPEIGKNSARWCSSSRCWTHSKRRKIKSKSSLSKILIR